MENEDEKEPDMYITDKRARRRRIEDILTLIRLIIYVAYLLFLLISNILNGYYVLALADCLFAGCVLSLFEKIVGGFISMFF